MQGPRLQRANWLQRESVLNQAERIDSNAIGQMPYIAMAPGLVRTKLCIKAGQIVRDDLSQALIWPMLYFEHSENVMIERVKSLVTFILFV